MDPTPRSQSEGLDRIYLPQKPNEDSAMRSTARRVGIAVAVIFIILGVAGAVITGMHSPKDMFFWISVAGGAVGLMVGIALIIWEVIEAKKRFNSENVGKHPDPIKLKDIESEQVIETSYLAVDDSSSIFSERAAFDTRQEQAISTKNEVELVPNTLAVSDSTRLADSNTGSHDSPFIGNNPSFVSPLDIPLQNEELGLKGLLDSSSVKDFDHNRSPNPVLKNPDCGVSYVQAQEEQGREKINVSILNSVLEEEIRNFENTTIEQVEEEKTDKREVDEHLQNKRSHRGRSHSLSCSDTPKRKAGTRSLSEKKIKTISGTAPFQFVPPLEKKGIPSEEKPSLINTVQSQVTSPIVTEKVDSASPSKQLETMPEENISTNRHPQHPVQLEKTEPPLEKTKPLPPLSFAFQLFLNHPSQVSLELIDQILDKGYAEPELGDALLRILQQKNWTHDHTSLFNRFVAVAQKQNLLDYQDTKGNTALHYATTTKQAQELISAGASLGIQNCTGQTPLHVNIQEGRKPTGLLRFLIKNASVETLNLTNQYGNSLLARSIWIALQSFSIDKDWQEIIFSLLAKGASIQSSLAKKELTDKLIERAYYDLSSRQMFKKLVVYAKRTDCINAQDHDGNTLLHKVKDLRQAKILIHAGASPGICNHKKITPLHLAIKEEWFAVFLANATPEHLAITDNEGNLPLHQWIQANRYSLTRVQSLFSLPVVIASIDLADQKGETLLHWAFQNRHDDLASLLLEYGSLSKANAKGITPLHLALSSLRQYSKIELAEQIYMKLSVKDAAYRDQNDNTWLHILATLSTEYRYSQDQDYLSSVIIQLMKLGIDSDALNKQDQKAIELVREGSFFQQAVVQGKQALQTALKEEQVFEIFGCSKADMIQQGMSPLLWFLNHSPNEQKKYQQSFKHICRNTNTHYKDLGAYLFDQSPIEDWSVKDKRERTLLQVLLELMIQERSEKELFSCWESLFLKLLEQKPSLLIKDGKSTLIHWLFMQSVHQLPPHCFDQLIEQACQQGHLDKQDSKGNTLLSLAVLKEKWPEAQRLIAKGADPTLPNKEGETTLSIAIKKCEDIDTLSALFADHVIYAWDCDGNTWLHYAAYHNNSTAIKVLQRKIPYLARNRSGSTPLHVAIKKGAILAIHALKPLLKENEIYSVDNQQNTFLHILAEIPGENSQMRFWLYCFLIEGLDPTRKNTSGKSAEELLKARDPETEKEFKLYFSNLKYRNTWDSFHEMFGGYSKRMHREDLQVLDLTPSASKTDVKKSFTKLALQNHPDKNQGITEEKMRQKTEKFRIAREAYVRLMQSTFFDQNISPPIAQDYAPLTPFHPSCETRDLLFSITDRISGAKMKEPPSLYQLTKGYLKQPVLHAKYFEEIKKMLLTNASIKYLNTTLLHWILELNIRNISTEVYGKIVLLFIEAAQREQCLDLSDEKGNTPFILCLSAACKRSYLFDIYKPCIVKIMENNVSIKSAIQKGLIYRLCETSAFKDEERHELFLKFVEQARLEGCLDTPDHLGNTFLHLVHNQKEAEILLQAGASVGIVNQDQKTALHLAAEPAYAYPDCFPLFATHATYQDLAILNKEGKTALHVWMKHHFSKREEVERILSLSPSISQNIDLQDGHGFTLLHWAIKSGYYDLAKLLVTKGASWLIADHDGVTPLQLVHNNLVLCLFLKDVIVEPVHINWQGNNQETLLHLAIKRPAYRLIKSLIKRGANPSIANAEGITPQMLVEKSDDQKLRQAFFRDK